MLKITRVDKDFLFNVQRDTECVGWIKVDNTTSLDITQNATILGTVKVKSGIFKGNIIFTPAINSFAKPVAEDEKEVIVHKVLRMCLCGSPKNMGFLDTLFEGECGNCGKKIYDSDDN